MEIKQEQIKTLIEDNTEVFQDVFLMTKPSDEDIKKAEHFICSLLKQLSMIT